MAAGDKKSSIRVGGGSRYILGTHMIKRDLTDSARMHRPIKFFEGTLI